MDVRGRWPGHEQLVPENDYRQRYRDDNQYPQSQRQRPPQRSFNPYESYAEGRTAGYAPDDGLHSYQDYQDQERFPNRAQGYGQNHSSGYDRGRPQQPSPAQVPYPERQQYPAEPPRPQYPQYPPQVQPRMQPQPRPQYPQFPQYPQYDLPARSPEGNRGGGTRPNPQPYGAQPQGQAGAGHARQPWDQQGELGIRPETGRPYQARRARHGRPPAGFPSREPVQGQFQEPFQERDTYAPRQPYPARAAAQPYSQPYSRSQFAARENSPGRAPFQVRDTLPGQRAFARDGRPPVAPYQSRLDRYDSEYDLRPVRRRNVTPSVRPAPPKPKGWRAPLIVTGLIVVTGSAAAIYIWLPNIHAH
jgi:hypothetical protein